MKMPISEIADRYSILLLKHERTTENLLTEINLYKNECDQYKNIDQFIKELYNFNGLIWDLESDIRKGKEVELGLEEIGRRALKIRDLNKNRVAIKNKMVEFYKEGFKDIKINHGSSEDENANKFF